MTLLTATAEEGMPVTSHSIGHDTTDCYSWRRNACHQPFHWSWHYWLLQLKKECLSPAIPLVMTLLTATAEEGMLVTSHSIGHDTTDCYSWRRNACHQPFHWSWHYWLLQLKKERLSPAIPLVMTLLTATAEEGTLVTSHSIGHDTTDCYSWRRNACHQPFHWSWHYWLLQLKKECLSWAIPLVMTLLTATAEEGMLVTSHSIGHDTTDCDSWRRNACHQPFHWSWHYWLLQLKKERLSPAIPLVMTLLTATAEEGTLVTSHSIGHDTTDCYSWRRNACHQPFHWSWHYWLLQLKKERLSPAIPLVMTLLTATAEEGMLVMSHSIGHDTTDCYSWRRNACHQPFHWSWHYWLRQLKKECLSPAIPLVMTLLTATAEEGMLVTSHSIGHDTTDCDSWRRNACHQPFHWSWHYWLLQLKKECLSPAMPLVMTLLTATAEEGMLVTVIPLIMTLLTATAEEGMLVTSHSIGHDTTDCYSWRRNACHQPFHWSWHYWLLQLKKECLSLSFHWSWHYWLLQLKKECLSPAIPLVMTLLTATAEEGMLVTSHSVGHDTTDCDSWRRNACHQPFHWSWHYWLLQLKKECLSPAIPLVMTLLTATAEEGMLVTSHSIGHDTTDCYSWRRNTCHQPFHWSWHYWLRQLKKECLSLCCSNGQHSRGSWCGQTTKKDHLSCPEHSLRDPSAMVSQAGHLLLHQYSSRNSQRIVSIHQMYMTKLKIRNSSLYYGHFAKVLNICLAWHVLTLKLNWTQN